MEGTEVGPRCTAVQQVRTKPDRMICDDGGQMRERDDRAEGEDRLRILLCKNSMLSAEATGAMATQKHNP